MNGKGKNCRTVGADFLKCCKCKKKQKTEYYRVTKSNMCLSLFLRMELRHNPQRPQRNNIHKTVGAIPMQGPRGHGKSAGDAV